MAWVWLFIAGLLEVCWAVGLKYTEGFTRLTASLVTLSAMAVSFLLLAHALKTIPVGTGYAVWTGIGAIGTAIVGMTVLNEPRGAGRIVCLFFIIAGIVGLKVLSKN